MQIFLYKILFMHNFYPNNLKIYKIQLKFVYVKKM